MKDERKKIDELEVELESAVKTYPKNEMKFPPMPSEEELFIALEKIKNNGRTYNA